MLLMLSLLQWKIIFFPAACAVVSTRSYFIIDPATGIVSYMLFLLLLPLVGTGAAPHAAADVTTSSAA